MSTFEAIAVGMGALIIAVVLWKAILGPKPNERGGSDYDWSGANDGVGFDGD